MDKASPECESQLGTVIVGLRAADTGTRIYMQARLSWEENFE